MNAIAYLKNTLGPFSYQPQRVVGISLEDDWLRVVQTRCLKGQFTVEKIAAVRVLQLSTAEKAKAIKELWENQNFERDNIMLTYPHREVIVKTLKLPSTDFHEVRAMALLQATRQTPLGIDEIEISSQILGKPSVGFSHVAVVIARKQEIHQKLELLRVAGLQPKQIVLDSQLLSWMKGNSLAGELSLVIELHEKSMMLGIFDGPTLCYTRSTSLPPRDSRESQALWSHKFQQEFSNTLRGYASTASGNTTPNVYLAGPEELTGPGQDLLHRVWHFQTRIFQPSQRVAFTGGDLEPKASACWPTLAASCIDMGKPSLNLLPQEEQLKQLRVTQRWEWMGASLCLLLSCGMLSVTLLQRFHSKRKELAQLTRASATLSDETKELRHMEQQIHSIQAQLSQEGSLLHVLAECNRLFPSRISMQSIDFEKDRSILFQGTCFSLSEAVQLVETLQKSALFSSVELRSSDIQRRHDQDLVDFVIACQLPARGLGGKESRLHAKV